MHLARTSSALLLVATLAGCGAPAGPPPVPTSPHGGTITKFPDGQIQVEIVRQDVAGQQDQAQLVLYFLDSIGKPLATPPTFATFDPRGRGKPITFKPSTDTEQAAAGALASNPFPNQGDVEGDLSMTLNDKPTSIAISIR